MEKRDILEEDNCESFTLGQPKGQCDSDGHYMCQECKYYREDFFKGGQEYKDLFFAPSFFYISNL